MTRIYKDPELRKQLILNGETQSKKFSWDATSQELWSTIKSMLPQQPTAKATLKHFLVRHHTLFLLTLQMLLAVPSQLFVCFASIAKQHLCFCGTKIFWVNFTKTRLLFLSTPTSSIPHLSTLHHSQNKPPLSLQIHAHCGLSGRNHIIARCIFLQHQPHSLNIFFSVAPVSFHT